MTRWSSLLASLLVFLPVYAPAGSVQVSNGTAGGNYSVRVTTLKEARFRNTIHQKYDFSCGSAAVATLLTYQYGFPVSEQRAFRAMFTHGNRAKIGKDGFSLLDIKRFLAAYGFEADGFVVPLDTLKQERLPAIVLIDEGGYHHFVVIKGMLDGRVLIGDPAKGTRSMPQTEFEKLWKNRLVFVIHNRRDAARFNTREDWQAAPMAALASGLDRDGLYNVVMPKSGVATY
ncbi:MAG TPA: C39 family peptidase [Rhodanobacteraceae bacterium]|nr:C39 family peptidase [Rhodanobacteraceae bacterium]